MAAAPVLSVIVPTHNRARYAVPTIQALLATSDEIEVVVSDTSAEDLLSAALAGMPGAARVRLVRPPSGVSVVDNFNAALQAASGDYLCFIGDDDLITGDALRLARWARRQGVDALCLAFPANYYWPDFHHRLRGDFYAGTVRVGKFSGRIRPHDPMRALSASARQLGVGVLDMPRAYAGMIARNLARRIIGKYGALFGGVSPDIYSAALIAQECNSCVHVDYPIVVPGHSGASTAGQSARGEHLGKLRDNPHIGAFKNLVWDPRIPEFYSVPTVWSFSLLEALKKTGTEHLAHFGRLYVRCLLFHRAYRGDTVQAIRHQAGRVGWPRLAASLAAGASAESAWVIGKLWSMLRVTLSGRADDSMQGVENTVAAHECLERFLAASPMSARFRSAMADPSWRPDAALRPY